MLLSSLLEQLSSNANPHWNAQLGISESHSDEKLISEEQCRKHEAGGTLLLKMAEKAAAEHEQQKTIRCEVKEQQQLHAI